MTVTAYFSSENCDASDRWKYDQYSPAVPTFTFISVPKKKWRFGEYAFKQGGCNSSQCIWTRVFNGNQTDDISMILALVIVVISRPESDFVIIIILCRHQEWTSVYIVVLRIPTMILTVLCAKDSGHLSTGQSMWAEQSGRFCRSALNLIFLISAHRSAASRSAPPYFSETRSPLRSAPPEFWTALLRFRSAHICHKLTGRTVA